LNYNHSNTMVAPNRCGHNVPVELVQKVQVRAQQARPLPASRADFERRFNRTNMDEYGPRIYGLSLKIKGITDSEIDNEGRYNHPIQKGFMNTTFRSNREVIGQGRRGNNNNQNEREERVLKVHPHASGHITRILMEMAAMYRLSDYIVIQVGGSAGRAARFGYTCHCINTVVDNYDEERAINNMETLFELGTKTDEVGLCFCGFDGTLCRHAQAFVDVQRTYHPNRQVALLFVHTSYYVTKQIENLYKNNTIAHFSGRTILIQNQYSQDIEGGFNSYDCNTGYSKEGIYYRSEDNEIVTCVDGNSNPYVHHDPSLFGQTMDYGCTSKFTVSLPNGSITFDPDIIIKYHQNVEVLWDVKRRATTNPVLPRKRQQQEVTNEKNTLQILLESLTAEYENKQSFELETSDHKFKYETVIDSNNKKITSVMLDGKFYVARKPNLWAKTFLEAVVYKKELLRPIPQDVFNLVVNYFMQNPLETAQRAALNYLTKYKNSADADHSQLTMDEIDDIIVIAKQTSDERNRNLKSMLKVDTENVVDNWANEIKTLFVAKFFENIYNGSVFCWNSFISIIYCVLSLFGYCWHEAEVMKTHRKRALLTTKIIPIFIIIVGLLAVAKGIISVRADENVPWMTISLERCTRMSQEQREQYDRYMSRNPESLSCSRLVLHPRRVGQNCAAITRYTGLLPEQCMDHDPKEVRKVYKECKMRKYYPHGRTNYQLIKEIILTYAEKYSNMVVDITDMFINRVQDDEEIEEIIISQMMRAFIIELHLFGYLFLLWKLFKYGFKIYKKDGLWGLIKYYFSIQMMTSILGIMCAGLLWSILNLFYARLTIIGFLLYGLTAIAQLLSILFALGMTDSCYTKNIFKCLLVIVLIGLIAPHVTVNAMTTGAQIEERTSPIFILSSCCQIIISALSSLVRWKTDNNHFTDEHHIFSDTNKKTTVENKSTRTANQNSGYEYHKHLCKTCHRAYQHKHKVDIISGIAKQHHQFKFQCPYSDCYDWYGFGGYENTTHALEIPDIKPYDYLRYEENGVEVIKPAVGRVSKNRDLPIKECNVNQRCKDGLMQIAPILTGYENANFVPAKLHSCYHTNTSAMTRNIIKRADFDEERAADFLNWWKTRRLQLYHWYYELHKAKCEVEEKNFSKYTVKEWLLSKEPAQRQEYQEAYEQILAGQLPHISKITSCSAHVKVDEKCEKIEKTRNITAQNAIAKVLMGVIVTFVSDAHKRFDQSYGSGMNWDQRQRKYNDILKRYMDPVRIDVDGSGFDGTQWGEFKQVIDSMRYEYGYELVQANISELPTDYVMEVLYNMDQYVTNYKTDYDYYVWGTVGSGFMSTSDGNGVRASEYIRYALSKIELIEGYDYFLETCGDDTFIITERQISQKVVDTLMKYVYTKDGTKGNLGQIAKYISISEIDGGNYLSSTMFRKKNGDYRIVRQVDRTLLYTPWTYNNNKGNTKTEKLLNAELCIANANSLLSWCTGIRFFEEYALMLRRIGIYNGAKDTCIVKQDSWNDRTNHDYQDCSVEYEEWLGETYGVTKDDLNEYYDALRKVKGQYSVIRLKLIDKISKHSSETVNIGQYNKDIKGRVYHGVDMGTLSDVPRID